jgi:hypothetical protein
MILLVAQNEDKTIAFYHSAWRICYLSGIFFMLMFVDNLLPALGIQLSLKSRQLFIIATVCMSFAWASGSVIKVIRQEQLKDRR